MRNLLAWSWEILCSSSGISHAKLVSIRCGKCCRESYQHSLTTKSLKSASRSHRGCKVKRDSNAVGQIAAPTDNARPRHPARRLWHPVAIFSAPILSCPGRRSLVRWPSVATVCWRAVPVGSLHAMLWLKAYNATCPDSLSDALLFSSLILLSLLVSPSLRIGVHTTSC